MTKDYKEKNDYQKLAWEISQNNCILFVGSGLSTFYGFPSWETLLHRMIDKTKENNLCSGDAKDLYTLLNGGKYIEVAQLCQEYLGKEETYKIIEENFKPKEDPPLSKVHKLLGGFPFSAIFTTNYDKILEKAFLKFGDAIKVYSGKGSSEDLRKILDEETSNIGKQYLLKLHGDIDDNDSIVFTLDDYNELIYEDQLFKTFLTTQFCTKTFLFLGYSLSDPNFQMILEKITNTFDQSPKIHYALMEKENTLLEKMYKERFGVKIVAYKFKDKGSNEKEKAKLHDDECHKILMNLYEKIKSINPSPKLIDFENTVCMNKKDLHAGHYFYNWQVYHKKEGHIEISGKPGERVLILRNPQNENPKFNIKFPYHPVNFDEGLTKIKVHFKSSGKFVFYVLTEVLGMDKKMLDIFIGYNNENIKGMDHDDVRDYLHIALEDKNKNEFERNIEDDLKNYFKTDDPKVKNKSKYDLKESKPKFVRIKGFYIGIKDEFHLKSITLLKN